MAGSGGGRIWGAGRAGAPGCGIVVGWQWERRVGGSVLGGEGARRVQGRSGFRTYSEPSGGTVSWEEAHEAVQVVGGRFSVLLGVRQPFAAGVVRGGVDYCGGIVGSKRARERVPDGGHADSRI